MPRTELPITGGFYQNRSLPISAQECVNAYVNVNQGDGLAKESLFGTPGLEQLATSGTVKQSNRGAHVKGGVPYFVNGTKLYSLDRAVDGDGNETFSLTELGTIHGTGRVSMSDNGNQLMVLVPGGNGYIYDENAGTPFQQITDADFTASGTPQYCVYIDGYFVVTTASKKFIVSSLNDGLSWNALDFGSAEADPDDIVAPVVHRNQLFIAGSETIEVFQNVGVAGFPFQRVEGFVIPKGCFAPSTLIQTGDTFMFIGGGVNESPSIYAFDGQGVSPISTDGIDGILQEFSGDEIASAFAWSYSQAGARFVGFSLPTTTLVFDTVSGRWHERRSQIVDANGTRDIRWRVNALVTAYNRVLVGDSQDGRVGSVDLNLFEEYGGNIIRRIATLPFANQGNSFKVPAIELTMESGVGDDVTEDPQIRLAISRDGKTFDSERSRPVGKRGEYNKRQIWRRNGRMARMAVFKFTYSEKCKFVIIKLEADIS